MADGILGFFSPEAGQARRRRLQEFGAGLEYYVPPELRQLVGLLGELNPVEGVGRAGQAAQGVVAPGADPLQRVEATGRMLSEMAGVAAPAAVAGRVGMPAAQAIQEGLLGFSAGAQDVGRAVANRLNQPGPMPTVYSNPVVGILGDASKKGEKFDIVRKDASSIFGAGAERVRYTDPKSGGTIEVVVRPDGSASVLELEVPETSRGQGIGQSLQERVMQDFPVMGGQVSSKAAAKTAYRLGRRPPGKPDATLDEVFASIDEMSSVNMVSPAMQARFAPALPTPRNEAEAMAKQILEMRAAGRSGDVTDEMMAAADPQYMFNNTPLPMDYESRMARAAGRRDEFHGTTTGSDMTYADAFRGYGSRQGIGFVTSDNPYVASSYADPQFGSVFPMLNEAPPVNAPRLDVGGEIWSQIPKDLPVQVGDRVITARDVAVGPADVGGVFDTNQLSRGASFDYPAIEFSNISDRSIHAPRPRTDDGMDVMREFQRKSSEPSTVTMRHDTRGMRSRFARFDPEFRHLRNLSAGLGALGLLAYPQEEY